MKTYLDSGTCKQYALWSPYKFGYMATYCGIMIKSGKIKPTPGTEIDVPTIGKRTIEEGGIANLNSMLFFTKGHDDFDTATADGLSGTAASPTSPATRPGPDRSGPADDRPDGDVPAATSSTWEDAMRTRRLWAAAAASGLLTMSGASIARADAFMDQVNAEVLKYAGPQSDWRGPTSSPKVLPGKTIAFMSTDEQNDSSREWSQAIAEAGAHVGWKVVVIDGHGYARRLAARLQPGHRAQGGRHRHQRRRGQPEGADRRGQFPRHRRWSASTPPPSQARSRMPACS